MILGINAHFEIKLEAGKAIVKLTAEVDVCPQQKLLEKNSVVEETVGAKSEPVSKDTLAVTAIVKNQNRKKLEKLLSKKTHKSTTEEVADEVCPNDVDNKTQPNPTTSGSAGSSPPSTSTRKHAFDYYTLTYDDLPDPD